MQHAVMTSAVLLKTAHLDPKAGAIWFTGVAGTGLSAPLPGKAGAARCCHGLAEAGMGGPPSDGGCCCLISACNRRL